MSKSIIVPDVDIEIKKFRNGHWDFPEQMGNGVGFIYVIVDLYFNKFYLGKKSYYGSGVTNKGVESNWRRYTSSSNILNEHIRERPRDEFKFIAIEEYRTKSGLSWSETWSLCMVEAPTKKEWYNTMIDKVSWNVKEGVTDRHKERLNLTLIGKL